MDWSHILTFVVMAIVVEVSPGPNFALISKTVTASGRACAFANIAGFALAFTIHGSLSIFGVSVILLNSPAMFLLVKLLGAGYLFYLGSRSLVKGGRPLFGYHSLPALPALASSSNSVDIDLSDWSDTMPVAESADFSSGFREGLVTNCLNPKISLFYLAIFPQFVGSGVDAGLESFLLVALHIAINAFWFFLVALVIDRLLRHARNGRAVHLMTFTSGIALIGFAVSFIFSALNSVT